MLVTIVIVVSASWGWNVYSKHRAAAKKIQIEKTAELEKTRKEQEQESRVQATVRNSLKDPDSAKFGKLVVVKPGMACIPVNARNSFGGYTGEKYVVLKNVGANGEWVINTDISGGNFADSLCRFSMLSNK